MIRPGRSTRYNATTGNTGSDTDALQTDVMRFMSILGLCLMAVFALVQSIPLQETVVIQAESEQEELHTAIAIQQERARVLQADLDRLIAKTQSAQAQKTLAQQALSTAQQQLTRVVDQVEQTRSAQEHLKTELDVLRHQLAEGRDKLAGIEQAARNKAQSLHALQQHLREQQKKLDDISKRASTLKKKRTPIPHTPVTEKHPSPVPAPVKKGFTLRFASDEALERQVAAGTVSLYAMAEKQAWRLSLSHGRPAFAHDTFPGWFHEMASSTVPIQYIRTLGTSMDRPAQSSIVWGVQLSPVTKKAIASLTRGRQGGSLVIAADGQVTLEPE
jgi:hypothetical protein